MEFTRYTYSSSASAVEQQDRHGTKRTTRREQQFIFKAAQATTYTKRERFPWVATQFEY
jgi:hypothetical protein